MTSACALQESIDTNVFKKKPLANRALRGVIGWPMRGRLSMITEATHLPATAGARDVAVYLAKSAARLSNEDVHAQAIDSLQ
jgi:hypothetical protein